MSLFKIWVDHSKKDSFVNTIRKKDLPAKNCLLKNYWKQNKKLKY